LREEEVNMSGTWIILLGIGIVLAGVGYFSVKKDKK
jgi:LPXTG-motif cell wall-anchored protein